MPNNPEYLNFRKIVAQEYRSELATFDSSDQAYRALIEDPVRYQNCRVEESESQKNKWAIVSSVSRPG